MPRASAAAVEQDPFENEEVAETPKAKKARTEKPIYVLYRVRDAEGNEVEGGTFEVVLATKDPAQVAEALSQEKVGMTRLELTKG